MSEVVIDLETRDTLLCSKVVSIGAVKLDFHRPFNTCIHSNFYIELDWFKQTNRSRSKSTDEFWESKSQAVKAALDGKCSLFQGLWELDRYISKGDVVWGNGSVFDIGILTHCYEQLNKNPPWHFRDVNDYRTIKRKYREKFSDLPYLDFEGTPHNALDDARHEARLLHKMWNSL